MQDNPNIDRKGTVYEDLNNLGCCDFEDIEDDVSQTQTGKKPKKPKKKSTAKPPKTFFDFGDSTKQKETLLNISKLVKEYSIQNNFRKLFIDFNVDKLVDDGYSNIELRQKLTILEMLVKQYKKKEKESPDEITRKRTQKKDPVFEIVDQLSAIGQIKERNKYLVFKIRFQDELPALLFKAESVTKAAQKIFDSKDLSKLLGIMVNGVNEGRRQYVKKTKVETPFVTGVPDFSDLTKLLGFGRINGLAMAIARKALSSSRSDILRIVDNMDILPTDLDGVIGYDIKEVTKHFSNLKKKSESIFNLKILQEQYRINSQQKLDNLEKEVKKMNTVIENIEKRYMIVSIEEETTLGQVFEFLKLWDEIVGKAKKEAAQNKKAGETKAGETKNNNPTAKEMLKTVQKTVERRRESIVGRDEDDWK